MDVKKDTIPCAVYKQPCTGVEGVPKDYILVRCSLGKYNLERTEGSVVEPPSWWQWLVIVVVGNGCW